MGQKNHQKVAKIAKWQKTPIGPQCHVAKPIFLYILNTSDYASPGFATWRIGGFGVFCHFGDFLPIWRFWQLFGDFFGSF